jgi:hypothetical protein
VNAGSCAWAGAGVGFGAGAGVGLGFCFGFGALAATIGVGDVRETVETVEPFASGVDLVSPNAKLSATTRTKNPDTPPTT